MKPNILLIISDALRPRDMSLYNSNVAEFDRNIKKIASESLVFENNFSVSNASDASVTSLFSGKLPKNNGFVHQHPHEKKEEIDKLKKNKFWLPIYLRDNGYITVSGTPLHLWFKKGFLDYKGRDDSKGVKKFLNLPLIKKILLALPNWIYRLGKKVTKIRASPTFYSAKEIFDSSILKIKQLQKTNKPFFLFMHLTDTHYPYASAKKVKTKGNKNIGEILNKLQNPMQKEYVKKRFYDISTKSVEEIKKRRDYAIEYVDKNIGKFYGILKNKGILNNTILILMSDHGDNFGEHNTYFCRGGLYDPSVHTPLIMKIPNVTGKRISCLTQNIDIPATILDVLNEKNKGKDIDGKSLLNAAKGKEIHKKIILSDGFCGEREAERTKTKKVITSKDGKCYLCGAEHHIAEREEYNLKEDSEELNNICKNGK